MDGWKEHKGTGLYHRRVIVRFTLYNLTLGVIVSERCCRSRYTMTIVLAVRKNE
jgi:hypothetical protein